MSGQGLSIKQEDHHSMTSIALDPHGLYVWFHQNQLENMIRHGCWRKSPTGWKRGIHLCIFGIEVTYPWNLPSNATVLPIRLLRQAVPPWYPNQGSSPRQTWGPGRVLCAPRSPWRMWSYRRCPGNTCGPSLCDIPRCCEHTEVTLKAHSGDWFILQNLSSRLLWRCHF